MVHLLAMWKMTATAPIYFDHEIRTQQSAIDAKFMAHAGFNKTSSDIGVDGKPIQYYEMYFNSGWHATAEAAKEELQQKLELAGWSSPG